jgi:hypothetical protein
MGTDIHGFLESRWERKDGSGTWLRECPIENTRNYRVFAALADVRNSYGFAGAATHAAIVPISQPRGLPDDRTKGYGEDAEFEFGDHSLSWLTLGEIAEWSGWDQELREVGWVNRDQYDEWLKNPGPPAGGWLGGISGYSIVHADHTKDDFPAGWTHVRISWSRPLREACGLFLTWTTYAQAKVGDRAGRIVFGFDS